MSKFGSDNGNKPKHHGPQGQNGHGSSPNGFRLDSTQSSWLMDRLNALNEEDKIAMAAHAERREHDDYPPQVSGREPYYPQAEYPPHRSDEGQEHVGVPELGATGSAHNDFVGEDQVDEESERPETYQMMDDEDPIESARLLRERIESLERQIAELSQKTKEEPEDYKEELIYRGAELGKLKAKERAYKATDKGQYYRGVPVALDEEAEANRREDIYELSPEELAEADYEYLREQLEPRLDAPGQDESQRVRVGDYDYPPQRVSEADYPSYQEGYNQDGYGQQDYSQQERLGYGQQAEAPYVPSQHISPQEAPHHQDAYYQDHRPSQRGEEQQPVLPQFLNAPQQEKIGRPKFVSIIGMLVAAAVIGAVGYNYLGQGVSDVVKGDFSLSGKEAAKLSDITPRRDLEVLSPKAPQVKQLVVAANPAQLAAQFKVSSLIGVAGQTIELPVQLPNLAEYPSAFLVLRDIPEWASVDSGRFVNGAWIISQAEASNVKVKIPDDQPGSFMFAADLVYSAQETPITQKVNAVIAPVTEIKKTQENDVVSARVPETVEQPEQIKTPEAIGKRGPLIIDEALEEKWLERGTRLLRAGDVAAARLAFSHLAEQGSGRGAMAMGMTFDPNQPSSRVVAGIDPDVKRARFWYQRALALGNEAAREQLRLLGDAE